MPCANEMFVSQQDAESLLHAKYQLMEVLGVGSTSTCHRCLNKKTDLHYACKVIDKRLIEDRFQGMMEQFHTEIDALRNLQHPNIIQLYDVYITEDKIFIVMELMEGGELFDYVVQKGTLTEDEAASIVHKVTSALVYMHSKNIVHRDLKPENLLLRRRPRHAGDNVEVKIIDFGLSKVGTSGSQHDHLIGFLFWLTPCNDSHDDYNLDTTHNIVYGRARRPEFLGNKRLSGTGDAATERLYQSGGHMGARSDCLRPVVWLSSI